MTTSGARQPRPAKLGGCFSCTRVADERKAADRAAAAPAPRHDTAKHVAASLGKETTEQ
jgi:hypothetical protein